MSFPKEIKKGIVEEWNIGILDFQKQIIYHLPIIPELNPFYSL